MQLIFTCDGELGKIAGSESELKSNPKGTDQIRLMKKYNGNRITRNFVEKKILRINHFEVDSIIIIYILELGCF